MRLGDVLKGLFRRADTGAAGGQPVADAPTAEGATSVPANPEGTPPAAEGGEINMGNPNLEGSSQGTVVEPDLGEPLTEVPSTSEQQIPVAEPEGAVQQEASVASPAAPEAEEPAQSAEAKSPTPPSLPETEAE